MKTDAAPKTIHLKDYTPYPYHVDALSLLVDIHDGSTTVTSTIQYRLKGNTPVPLELNGEQQKLESVLLNDRPLTAADYTVDDKILTLPCLGENPFTLTITTVIEPEKNTALEGLYRSNGTWCTQCESEGFRKITYFPDRPDVLTIYTVRVQADKKTAPVLLSNGNLIASGDLSYGRHFATFEDPYKKPCYLFALVAGQLVEKKDIFITRSKRKVRLSIFTSETDQHQVDYAMHALKCSMKWDEDAYGLEYQFDRFAIVAVHDFTFGAMENTSLNIFNTKLVLAHPDTATDVDYNQIMRVVGHEYFHNWSGNRVTCRDWFQLTLKEGLTVFRENQFGQAMFDADDERIDEVRQMRELQFPEDAGPLSHPIRPESYIEINNFYTSTVYEKGAEVIRMLATLLGPELYRKATDLYFSRHDGQAVTCEDFVRCMEDVSKQDLSQFRRWYAQSGTPQITAAGRYDAKAKTYTLRLSQTTPPTPGQPTKEPYIIPVACSLVGGNGQKLDMGGGQTEQVLVLQSKAQEFVFNNIPSAPVPSLLRGFSAPVKLDAQFTRAEKLFLLTHDNDGFVRWDVLQSFLQDAILAGDIAPDLIETCGHLMGELAGARPALLARLLTLPSLNWLVQQTTDANPAAIQTKLEFVQAKLGKALLPKFLDIYKNSADKSKTFSAESAAIATRSLHNVALDYICAGDPVLGAGLATAQYNAAKTMTARIGALSPLMDGQDPARGQLLADYYERFKHHPLALDKWFALQGKAVRDTTLADIRALIAHPDFSLKNPNRARALLASFAMMNLAKFHAADGGGYRLICDMALQLDGINAAVSARLLTAFKTMSNRDKNLQAKAKVELQRVEMAKNLSSQAFEVVSKTLASLA